MVLEIDVAEAHRRQGSGWTYIDVRSPAEWHGGHPVGAVLVPAFLPGPMGMEPVSSFVDDMRAKFAPSDLLLIGCASGQRSKRACAELAAAGFTQVVNVAGGFNGSKDPFGNPISPGWRGAGFPVEQG